MIIVDKGNFTATKNCSYLCGYVLLKYYFENNVTIL